MAYLDPMVPHPGRGIRAAGGGGQAQAPLLVIRKERVDERGADRPGGPDDQNGGR
jgi:hypothetical protein